MPTIQYGTKFGVVDFESILKQSTKIQKLVDQWHASPELATLRDNVVQAEKKVEAFKVALNSFNWGMFVDLALRKPDWNPETRQYADLNNNLKLQNDLLNQGEYQHVTLLRINARNEIQELVKKVAKENGLNLVLNSTSDVFFMDDAADITNDILALYDAK